MTGPLTADGLALNPNAAHPPFPWLIGVPSTWTLLDTNPTSWQRSTERLVDDRFAGRKLPAAERRGVLEFFEQLVSDCQRAGTALSMVQLGRLSTGAVGSAGLHLAWYDSSPEPAGLALAWDALPQTGIASDVDTPLGPAVLHKDSASAVPSGLTTRVRSVILQMYLPLPDTSWMAVLSAATPHPEMEPILEKVIVAVACSISPVDPDALEPEPSSGEEPNHAPEATSEAGGTSVEQRFGPLVQHQVSGSPEAGQDSA